MPPSRSSWPTSCSRSDSIQSSHQQGGLLAALFFLVGSGSRHDSVCLYRGRDSTTCCPLTFSPPQGGRGVGRGFAAPTMIGVCGLRLAVGNTRRQECTMNRTPTLVRPAANFVSQRFTMPAVPHCIPPSLPTCGRHPAIHFQSQVCKRLRPAEIPLRGARKRPLLL